MISMLKKIEQTAPQKFSAILLIPDPVLALSISVKGQTLGVVFESELSLNPQNHQEVQLTTPQV